MNIAFRLLWTIPGTRLLPALWRAMLRGVVQVVSAKSWLAIGWVLVLFVFGGWACSGPRVRVIDFDYAPPLPENCEPYVMRPGFPAPGGARFLGEARYGDTGFSVRCNELEVRELLRRHACNRGADAVLLVKESRPNWVSTCYRVVAQLYQLGEPMPPETEVLIVRPTEPARAPQ